MFPSPVPTGAPPPNWQISPDVRSAVDQYWQKTCLSESLSKLRDTISLAKSMHQELESILSIKGCDAVTEELDGNCSGQPHEKDLASIKAPEDSRGRDEVLCSELIKAKKIGLQTQESLSVEAANSLFSTLRDQLLPFDVVTSQTRSWEEKSAAVRLANKIEKAKRNKLWRKRKRKRVAERLCKEREMYDQLDQDADEWRAREIAKDIAKRKVEKMKEIAKVKAKEEKKKLESELELVMVVEKLQELRSVRIQKLKKQGHFLPEEDDKFLQRVRAAVEEEERQAAIAADTGAAKDAIAIAEESRLAIRSVPGIEGTESEKSGDMVKQEDTDKETGRASGKDAVFTESAQKGPEVQRQGGGYESTVALPLEFYHYYHGSNNDMGTLIEVRRVWDAYLRPGGSRIPGHWVLPPPPADDIWASYLVKPGNA
ncbi:U11/U12 small nuclear ribonucleoprotein [Nymphaea thermarum]|nr:U11/U12 small nuclear ribonucleoprotein [Nymphaea thermarum]